MVVMVVVVVVVVAGPPECCRSYRTLSLAPVPQGSSGLDVWGAFPCMAGNPRGTAGMCDGSGASEEWEKKVAAAELQARDSGPNYNILRTLDTLIS